MFFGDPVEVEGERLLRLADDALKVIEEEPML
jgi:hypothetical protein